MSLKRLLFILVILLSMLSCIDIKANVKKIAGYSYKYVDYKKGVWIINISKNNEKAENNGKSTLVIPSSINGKKVLRLGSLGDDGKNDANVRNLFGVYEDEESEMGKRYSDKNSIVSKLHKIKIPATVSNISPYCFRYMGSGKEINIPKKVTKNLEQFCYGKWGKVTISKKNKKYISKKNMLLSKNGKIIYGYMGKEHNLILPESVTQIARNAFEKKEISSVYLSKYVNKIGKYAFAYSNLSKIEISKKNKHYQVSNNCLFSKKSGRLLVAIAKKGTVIIPEGVTCLKDGTVFISDKIQKIVFPKTISELKYGRQTVLYYDLDNINIIFKGTSAPKETGGFPPGTKMYVPKGLARKYISAYKTYIEYGTIKSIKEV